MLRCNQREADDPWPISADVLNSWFPGLFAEEGLFSKLLSRGFRGFLGSSKMEFIVSKRGVVLKISSHGSVVSVVFECENSKNRKRRAANGDAAIVPLSTMGNRKPIRKFSIDCLIGCLQNQRLNSASTDSPLQRIKEKSWYRISVSTLHRRYGHRLRTPFFAGPVFSEEVLGVPPEGHSGLE